MKFEILKLQSFTLMYINLFIFIYIQFLYATYSFKTCKLSSQCYVVMPALLLVGPLFGLFVCLVIDCTVGWLVFFFFFVFNIAVFNLGQQTTATATTKTNRMSRQTDKIIRLDRGDDDDHDVAVLYNIKQKSKTKKTSI